MRGKMESDFRNVVTDGKCEKYVLLLSGTWDFKYSPESRWTSIQVPGEAAMQGFAIEHDKPFFYKKDFTIPADYAGKRLILRFDGKSKDKL